MTDLAKPFWWDEYLKLHDQFNGQPIELPTNRILTWNEWGWLGLNSGKHKHGTLTFQEYINIPHEVPQMQPIDLDTLKPQYQIYGPEEM